MKPSSQNDKALSPPRESRWDFLTNHAHVLTCVAHDPGIRVRDIAEAVGITERGAHRIVSELIDEGYLLREKEGAGETARGRGGTVRCAIPSRGSKRWGTCSRS